MVGSVFKQRVKEETRISWEEWERLLDLEVNPSWLHEQLVQHLTEKHGVALEWSEWNGWLSCTGKKSAESLSVKRHRPVFKLVSGERCPFQKKRRGIF